MPLAILEDDRKLCDKSSEVYWRINKKSKLRNPTLDDKVGNLIKHYSELKGI